MWRDTRLYWRPKIRKRFVHGAWTLFLVHWTIECYCQWVIAGSEFAWTWFPEVKVITLSHRLNVRMSCSVLILKRAEMHKSLPMRSCSFAQQEKMTWRKLFWVQQKHDEMKEIFWKVLFFLELNCYLFDQTITSGNLLKAKVFSWSLQKMTKKTYLCLRHDTQVDTYLNIDISRFSDCLCLVYVFFKSMGLFCIDEKARIKSCLPYTTLFNQSFLNENPCSGDKSSAKVLFEHSSTTFVHTKT